MSYCEDYPCCGHTPQDRCDETVNYEQIYAHLDCEHEAGYCAVAEREAEDEEDWT